MLLLKKSQNHIFIFRGLSVQIQHLSESASTQIFTLYMLQQDDVWAEDGVCMKEGIWLIALIVLCRSVSRPPDKHHKRHKNSKSGANKFVQKSRSHLKSLGTKRVTRSMFHAEDPHITGATVKNIVSQPTWRPGFVHPCNKFTWNVEQRCEQWRKRGTRRAGVRSPPGPFKRMEY
jgi:hypothetical protein